MKQSSINYFIKKQSLKYSDSHISVNFNNIVFEKNKSSSDKKNLYILLFFSLYNTLHLEETSPAYFFQNLAEKIFFLLCISNLQSSICNHFSKSVPPIHTFFWDWNLQERLQTCLKASWTGRFSNHKYWDLLTKGIRRSHPCSPHFAVFSNWTSFTLEVQRFWWQSFIEHNKFICIKNILYLVFT